MIRGFVEIMGNVGPERMEELVRDKVVSGYYVMVGPDREAGVANIARWDEFAVPKWAWYVCTPDQERDAAEITRLHEKLKPVGWCLNIEKPLEGAKLDVLLKAVSACDVPIVASLAGTSASHIEYDYRGLDRHDVAVDWQAYFDSGEGQTPAISVEELYRSSFVVPGREFRHRLASGFGWGRITRIEQGQRAMFDSYRRAGTEDGYISVTDRAWGFTVVSRTIWRGSKNVGVFLGKASYPNIRVTLDVTRTAKARTPVEWTPIAASARVPGAGRRGISVYLIEHASNEVLRAIAAGAG